MWQIAKIFVKISSRIHVSPSKYLTLSFHGHFPHVLTFHVHFCFLHFFALPHWYLTENILGRISRTHFVKENKGCFDSHPFCLRNCSFPGKWKGCHAFMKVFLSLLSFLSSQNISFLFQAVLVLCFSPSGIWIYDTRRNSIRHVLSQGFQDFTLLEKYQKCLILRAKQNIRLFAFARNFPMNFLHYGKRTDLKIFVHFPDNNTICPDKYFMGFLE